MVFEILTFGFCLEEKRQLLTTVKTERISLSPTQYCALLVNLIATSRQSVASVEEKMVNY